MRAFRCYSVTALPAIEPTGRPGGHLRRTNTHARARRRRTMWHGKRPPDDANAGGCAATARGRAFLFLFELFMAFAAIRESMMLISGSQAASRSRHLRECGGAKSVPADDHGHVETNKRAPEDAGGICAERGESRDPTARRFTRREGDVRRPPEVALFFFCFRGSMTGKSIETDEKPCPLTVGLLAARIS